MLRKGVRLCTATVLMLALLLSTAPSLADCPVLVLDYANPTSSASGRAPMARYRSIHTVYLITPAEMAASGFPAGVSPNGIGWRYTQAPGVAVSGFLSIYLQNTADTAYSKGSSWLPAISGMTLVHNATVSLPNAAAFFDVKFQGGSPFTYTGGGVYVAFDWYYPSPGALSTAAIVSTTTVLTNGVNGIATSQTTGTPPAVDPMTSSAFRPETWLLTTVPNDVSVDNIKTYGFIPNPLGASQVIAATVSNHSSTAVVGMPVTLNITGANPFSDTQLQDLAACGQATVSFEASPSAILGNQTATVTVPADDVPANNTRSAGQRITENQLSYKYVDRSSDAGIGIGFFAREFTAMFKPGVSTQIDSVMVDFPFNLPASTYKVSIRLDDGSGIPGAQIYLDASDRVVVAGNQTLRLPSPVIVPAAPFFVGVVQTNANNNISLGFNYEFPLRSGVFFVSDVDTFIDLTTLGGANYKLNLGAVLGSCLAHMSVDVTPNSGSACANGNIIFTANTTNATGARTYQWTENGVNIPGATSSTRTVTKSQAGSFTYNCKVTDDAGCIDIVDFSGATGTWATSPPAETAGLALSPNTQTLTWSPAPFATRYDVVRGNVAQLPVGPGGGDEICFPDVAGTTISDSTVPLAGAAFWYDVRGKNACGQGAFGFQSNGAPRVTTTCP